MQGTRQRVRRQRQRRFAVAGTLAAVVMGAVIWGTFPSKPIATANLTPASVVLAVPARQTLADGTVVELKEGAEISVAYSPAFRRVNLVRGEAHFLVTKDKTRPFIVAVDSVEVRAVGTSFSVQRRPSQVEVLVTTGRVAVDRVEQNNSAEPATAPHTIATLDPGHHTTVEVAANSAAPAVEALSEAEVHQRLAWRMPRLEFTHTPLDEAILMINQHSAVKISLADPALGQVKISGLLRVDNVETLFKLLETEHRIEAERRGPDEVVLRAKR